MKPHTNNAHISQHQVAPNATSGGGSPMGGKSYDNLPGPVLPSNSTGVRGHHINGATTDSKTSFGENTRGGVGEGKFSYEKAGFGIMQKALLTKAMQGATKFDKSQMIFSAWADEIARNTTGFSDEEKIKLIESYMGPDLFKSREITKKNPDISYEEWARQMNKVISGPLIVAELEGKFYLAKQGPDELIEDFVERVAKAGRACLARQPSEREIWEKVEKGMTPPYKVKTTMLPNNISISKMIELLKMWEIDTGRAKTSSSLDANPPGGPALGPLAQPQSSPLGIMSISPIPSTTPVAQAATIADIQGMKQGIDERLNTFSDEVKVSIHELRETMKTTNDSKRPKKARFSSSRERFDKKKQERIRRTILKKE